MPLPSPTAGFAFVEFATPDPVALVNTWTQMGFAPVAQHKNLPVTLYRQGRIYFALNEMPSGHAADFARAHGPAAAGAGFYCTDPAATLAAARQSGLVIKSAQLPWLSQPIDALVGIGGSLIYLCPTDSDLFTADFEFTADANNPGIGLQQIDHLSFNVLRGDLELWAEKLKAVFGFREIRYFNIHGKKTALRSRALLSACETMRITINESMDEQSQIAEFIQTYKGAGIQHIALAPHDIYATVEAMHKSGLPFVPVPGAYYDAIKERYPNSGEDIERMRRNYILLDGANEKREILLQIVTTPIVGPLFFEVIQRKGCDGFGEGNFTALFEALERDQIARGVLAA